MDVIQRIKKYVVSSGLVVLFVFYVVFQKVTDLTQKSPITNLPMQNNVADTLPTSVPATIPNASIGTQLKNIINRFSEGEDDEEGKSVVPKPSTTAVATATPVASPIAAPAVKTAGLYKDGAYTGTSMDVYYGSVQVKAVVQNGKLVDVIILDQPRDRQYSAELAAYAMPILRTEAIKVQSANVNIVSGATATSGGFKESLATALALAKN